MSGDVTEYLSPSRAGLIARYTINVWSPEMVGPELIALGIPTVGNTAPGANLITLFPFVIPSPFSVSQFFWVNGSTVNGDSYIGVYGESGSLLVSSGAILNSGASVKQVVDITDYALAPGKRYWLALGTSSASHQYQRLPIAAPLADYIGIKTMASGISGGALVSSVAFAVGGNNCFMCGMTGASVM